MTVKIEMDMPQNCKVCPLHKYKEISYFSDSLVCGLANGLIGNAKCRPTFCPLKECE